MKNLLRMMTLVGICLISLFVTRPALAFPPLPSSFYGTVKVDGANVPDGSVVKALINGQTYATAHTQTYQGDSVYSLDVLGDDSSTTTIEGGQDGDIIVFTIGEEAADQTGIWKSGTNVNLDLSANTRAPTSAPVPTMTQSGVPLTEETTVSPTTDTLYLPGVSNPSQDATTPIVSVQAAPGKPTGTRGESIEANSGRIILIFGVLLFALIVCFILWLIFARKPKN